MVTVCKGTWVESGPSFVVAQCYVPWLTFLKKYTYQLQGILPWSRISKRLETTPEWVYVISSFCIYREHFLGYRSNNNDQPTNAFWNKMAGPILNILKLPNNPSWVQYEKLTSTLSILLFTSLKNQSNNINIVLK